MLMKPCSGESREPSKKTRALTTDAQIQQIRENISRYPRARMIADKIIKAADQWAGLSDSYLWEMIPPSDIPRAFNTSFEGCPVHGMEYFKYGNYSWKMDPFNKPWKLVCPVGGEEYPSNDFWAYYKTKDKSLLTGDYPDDGWGWRKPGDKYKHWFVAYYCHWLWANYITPAVENLSLAYQITGDKKYAQKAAVMLYRIADLYPSMDHNTQSRYATEFAPGYHGKILNRIWETGIATSFAKAYDNIFDALSKDEELIDPSDKDSPLAGKTNAEIRANIEENLLREAVRAVYEGKIEGNYGMHQRTLLALALVLQDESLSRKATDYVLNNVSGSWPSEGYTYALDNFILREGIAFESAPGYCLSWCSSLANVGEYLDLLGADIYANPKCRRMFRAYDELKVLGLFTPAIGDSGDVGSGAINLSATMARIGLRRFRDPLFARSLLEQGIFGENSFQNYEDLKSPPLDESELRRLAKKPTSLPSGSRNLGGYGLAILETGVGKNGVGASVYYGPSNAGHAHWDKLVMEIFGYGKKLIPDLGYPQFAAEAKAPPAWERNTISHCTVTVNASRQESANRGFIRNFAVTPDVRVLDVSAPNTYSCLREYRRVVLLIGGEGEEPYLVDFFVVKGGKSHDYSLPGSGGKFDVQGIQLSPIQKRGTLAGEDVPYGFLYDDPELEKKDSGRSFFTYRGSGYSFLYDVQRGHPSDTWMASWEENGVGIRAFFPRQDLTEVVIAKGNPPKRPQTPEYLNYVLLRHSGQDGLHSRFVCVFQPFDTSRGPFPPLEVRRVTPEVLSIRGKHGTDYVYLAEDPTREVIIGSLALRGTCIVLRTDTSNRVKSVFISEGGYLRQGLLSVSAGPSLTGHVLSVDLKRNEVTLDSNVGSPVKRTILFGSVSYTAETATQRKGKTIIGLGEYTPRSGKIAVDSIDPGGRFLTTKNFLYFASSGCYKDAWLTNEDFTVWHQITDVSDGMVTLREPADLRSEFVDKDGDGRIIAYLYDIGPGQTYTVPAVCWAGKGQSGWRMEATTPATAHLPDGTTLCRH